MDLEPKRKIAMPFWGLNTIFAISAFGWLLASFFLGKTQPGEIWQTASVIGVHIFEAILIGTSVGIAVNLYLKHALGETPKAILEKGNIDTIYVSRQSAENEFKALIKDKKKIKQIDLIGASLRDFLTSTGALREVWEYIQKRLRDEERMKLPGADRLRVRLLLLDPQSGEGRFRYKVESTTLKDSAGLPEDVSVGIREVFRVQQLIFGDTEENRLKAQEFLSIRLYEHCPFAFMLCTESELYTQQYDYRDHLQKSVIPFIKYLANSPQYGELRYSYETIWSNAQSVTESKSNVGTASAIERARIKNIYRRGERDMLSNRQNECLAECLKDIRPHERISILAITGNHYVKPNALEALRKVASKENGGKGISVRLAIVNPVSQQAILRGVADSAHPKKIGETLRDWSWTKHKNLRLYQDVHRTMDEIELWKEECAFEIHLYTSAISCALLLTPRSKFIEQYVYGRSEKYLEGRTLGGEYPVVEYDARENESGEKIEQEILASTFDVIWDHYSIKAEEYKKADEELEFNKNLVRLLEELNLKTPEQARHAGG